MTREIRAGMVGLFRVRLSAQEGIEMGARWYRWPPLRWGLVLPTAAIAWVACDIIGTTGLSVFTLVGQFAGLSQATEPSLVQVGQHLVVFASYLAAVLAGAGEAPRAKRIAAVAVCLLFMMMRTHMTLNAFYGDPSFTEDTPAQFLVGTIAAGTGGIVGIACVLCGRGRAEGTVARKEAVMAVPCELRIGPYCLGQSYAAVGGSLTEVDPAIAATLGPVFGDERIYHGSPVTFASLEWETTLSITQGRVWKIMLSLGPDWVDWGDEFRSVRDVLLREFGDPAGHSVHPGSLEWQRPWGGIHVSRSLLGDMQGLCVILTAAGPVRAKWDAPAGEGLWFRAKLLMNLVRSVAPLSRQRFLRNFLSWEPEEQQRWALLRAIEWGKWPLFVAQPIAPLLLLVAPWWTVMAGVVLLSWCWCLVRYRFVSVALVNLGAYVALLKWPVCLGIAVYFAICGSYGLAALSALWPALTLILISVVPRTQIGQIQQMLTDRLLYGSAGTGTGTSADVAESAALVQNPCGPELGRVIDEMTGNHAIQWPEILERLNPSGDMKAQQALIAFRLGRYEFDPWLAVKVLLAAYSDLARGREQNADFHRLLGQPDVELWEVCDEAMRQTERIERPHR